MTRAGILAGLIAILAVGRWAPACAEEATLLQLDEAIEIALVHNRRLATADARMEQLEAATDQARALRRPRIELNETVSRTTNPVFVFGNLLGQEAFGAANFDPAFLNRPDPLSNFNTRVSVLQPIYSSGKIGRAIDSARAEGLAVEAERERTRQEVVEQVVASYTGALIAREQLALSRAALGTARANVSLVRDLREAGLVVESDLLRARLRQTEIEEQLIDAESALAVARAALNLHLGRDLDTPYALPAELEPAGRDNEALEQLVEEARSNRPDLLAAERHVDLSRSRLRLAQAGRLPEVGLVGQYEANAEQFVGADGDNWSLFLNVRFSLYDPERRARIRGSAAGSRIAERTRDQLGDGIGLQVHQAFYDLDAASRRLERTELAVGLAEESLRIVQDRYREGLTTLVELLDAETELTAAQTRRLEVRRDLLLAGTRLDLAVGRL